MHEQLEKGPLSDITKLKIHSSKMYKFLDKEKISHYYKMENIKSANNKNGITLLS